VTRAAGLALTKVLASEFAPDNVLVNALLTGTFKTEQMRRMAKPGQSEDEFFEAMGKRFPMGRVGEPVEFANMACFLASDAASFITGAGINTDGGQAAAP
jgi:NAD(P)-dependent dehydrogenase (short-subunit alcohol dehydrogenase family)